MRSLRFVAALGLGLTPLLGSAGAGTVPAFAGGGAGMALTATMTGQDQRLLVGTTHVVTIVVTDTPGESDLRHITVNLDDMDPRPLTVICPAGVNGQLSLQPEQSLRCTAIVTAESGFRTLIARARGQVPGGSTLTRSVTLHYTGYLPPPAPVTHAAVKGPLTTVPAATRPQPTLLTSPPAQMAAAPPVMVAADPPGGAEGSVEVPMAGTPVEGGSATGGAVTGGSATSGATAGGPCAGGAESGCCADGTAGTAGTAGAGTSCCDQSGSGCAKSALASGGAPHGQGALAFTGMSPMLATATAIGLGLIAGGTLLIRRVARR